MTDKSQTAEIIDRNDVPPASSAIVTAPSAVPVETAAAAMARFERMQAVGFIAPIANPQELREAFRAKQALYTAILDEDDFIYTVTFRDPKARAIMTRDRAYALEMVEKAPGTRAEASPMKRGVNKLARALGITATRVRTLGLPDESTAGYSFVEYEAVHNGTGISEIGVGWCDRSERSKVHDIIATADTRAYNRAVLRLAGFGDVSADEIIAGASDGVDLPDYVPEGSGMKRPDPVPPLDDPSVMAAARAWAEAIADRPAATRFAAGTQQITQSARELRARARRGDHASGRALGTAGLRFDGAATDGLGYEPFESEPSPVTIEDVEAARAAQQQAETAAVHKAAGAPNAAPAPAPAADNKAAEGWDLSAKGSEADDAPATEDTAEHKLPQPDLGTDVITTAQAKRLSSPLLTLVSKDKARAQAWVRKHLGIESGRTVEVRANQYEPALALLTKLTKEN